MNWLSYSKTWMLKQKYHQSKIILGKCQKASIGSNFPAPSLRTRSKKNKGQSVCMCVCFCSCLHACACLCMSVLKRASLYGFYLLVWSSIELQMFCRSGWAPHLNAKRKVLIAYFQNNVFPWFGSVHYNFQGKKNKNCLFIFQKMVVSGYFLIPSWQCTHVLQDRTLTCK